MNKWILCRQDRDEKLGNLISSDEQFECKIWATIMATDIELLKKTWYLGMFAGAAGAFTNQYCYMGICNSKLYVSVVETFAVERERYNLAIPFQDIKKVKVKGGILPKRKVVYLYGADNKKMKIAVMLNAIGSDIKDQEPNALKFFELLSAIHQ